MPRWPDLVPGPDEYVQHHADTCYEQPDSFRRDGWVLIEYSRYPGSKFCDYRWQRIAKKTERYKMVEAANDRRMDTTPSAAEPPKTATELKAEITALRIQVHDLKTENNDLKAKVEQPTQALSIYGEPKDLATVTERVKLAPYAASLDEKAVKFVTQVCWAMGWNPFFDLHAFKNKRGVLTIMPDYKKLLELVREQVKIDYRSRPMTVKEREDYGLKDTQVGFVTEIYERDALLEYAKAGYPDLYHPILGFGVCSKDEDVPATWTLEMKTAKRSLRHGLYQLVPYKIATQRLNDALIKAGAVKTSETEDGWQVETNGVIEGELVAETKPFDASVPLDAQFVCQGNHDAILAWLYEEYPDLGKNAWHAVGRVYEAFGVKGWEQLPATTTVGTLKDKVREHMWAKQAESTPPTPEPPSEPPSQSEPEPAPAVQPEPAESGQETVTPLVEAAPVETPTAPAELEVKLCRFCLEPAVSTPMGDDLCEVHAKAEADKAAAKSEQKAKRSKGATA